MKLDDFKPSENVEDRRGQGGGGFGFPRGGRGGGIPIGVGRGGFSFKTILFLIVIYFVFKFLFGLDLLEVLNGGGGSVGPTTPQTRYEDSVTPGNNATNSAGSQAPVNDDGSLFVKKVLTSTEVFWTRFFQQHGETYEKPKLVLFEGFVQSACGMAQSAMGPFYCPGDRKVYIDLSFYHDLRAKLGAPGDFAQGYVIAHEVGHHIQNLVGTAQKVQAQRMRVSKDAGNALSVRMELQADCYAGMWGGFMDASQHLDVGDIEEGINAAAAIGDDRLQKRSQGYAVPESFTHGSSEQRVRWFTRGYQAKSLSDCDTFSATSL